MSMGSASAPVQYPTRPPGRERLTAGSFGKSGPSEPAKGAFLDRVRQPCGRAI
jgi:hypothetical protein